MTGYVYGALLLATVVGEGTGLAGGAAPVWSANRQHRLLARVEPVAGVTRDRDELVASVTVDFSQHLRHQRCDLSSLVVIGYSPRTGEVVDYPYNVYATTPGEVPLRFYDADIPWDYPDPEGYAMNTDGRGTPIRMMSGGGRFFNAIGQGRAGTIAWPHTQHGTEPSAYAIYFNTLPDASASRPAPAGFIGDGVNRCLKTSPTFAPVFQGRVALADFDGDGLFDLLMGHATGTVLWYRNVGRPGAPRFDLAVLLLTDDGKPLDIGWSSAPAAVDWDRDGDLDLIVGAEKESFVYFRNIGDARSPKLHFEGLLTTSDGKPLRTPKVPCKEDPEGKIYPYDYYPVPEVVDWDGDGDSDLLAGGYITGVIFLYENTADSEARSPQLVLRGPLQADGEVIDVAWCASPCAADFDGDGDLDLVSGAMQMTAGGGDASDPERFLWYFENVGTRSSPRLAQRPFPARGRFRFGALGTPRAVDFNRDGLLDLVVSVNGTLLMLENIGTRHAPLFDASTEPTETAWGNTPLGFSQLVDYNGDGWTDLFQNDSVLLNTGRGAPGIFGSSIPLLAEGKRIYHAAPQGDHWDYRSFADMNRDGTMDILVGDHAGNVWLHCASGSKERPLVDPEGIRLRLTSGELLKVGDPPGEPAAFDVLQGARTAQAAGDYNHDGWMDLVVCDTYGYIYLFTRVPGDEVVLQPGVELGRLHPTRLIPGCTDWNGDGWDDLLAAYASGDVYILVNQRKENQAAFHEPQPVKIPPCFGEPWIYLGDWNGDGDEDMLIQQYGYLRFVERSFLEHGYVPARIVRYEGPADIEKSKATTPRERERS